MKGCTVIQATRGSKARHDPRRRRAAAAPRSSSTSAAAPSCPTCPGVATSPTDQLLDPRPRSRAGASGGHRRQLHRPRVRADVPPLRRRGDRRREGPAADRREDEEVSEAIQEILEAEGIDVRLGAKCIAIRQARERRRSVDSRDGAEPIVGSHLLLAVGRRPEHRRSRPRRAGVATDARGYITVDDQLRTNVPGIWAMGDCNGRGAFTHTRTTTSRSSPPTCSTATAPGQRSRSPPTRSTSIRRLAAWA